MPTVGLALPASRSSGGYFASRNQYDTAWGDLILAVMCPIGGRAMKRKFGSDLSTSLYEPNDAVLQTRLKQAFLTAATRHVPTVQILDVTITSSGTTVSASVSFTLLGDNATPQNRLVKLDRSATMKFLSVRSR